MSIYTILTLVFVVLGCIYLFRRRRQKNVFPEILNNKKNDTKLTIDEEFNLNRSRKEGQLDELLDKINKKGFASLSTKEKELLKELSK